MSLLISPVCCCLRSRINGRVFALCSRCRAAVDPDFAKRCEEASVPPVKKAKPTRRRR